MEQETPREALAPDRFRRLVRDEPPFLRNAAGKAGNLVSSLIALQPEAIHESTPFSTAQNPGGR
jgi:hypothetical protein